MRTAEAGEAFVAPAPLDVFKCACGYGTALPRVYCPRCRDLLRASTSSPWGAVLTWTILHVRPDGAREPSGLCVVGLESGINVMAKFDPRSKLAVGDRVAVALATDGVRWISRSAP